MARRYDIIDADSHVLEPPDLWMRYIAAEFRERAPRVIKDADGEEWMSVEGKNFGGGDRIGLRSIGAVGARDGMPYPNSYEEGTPGGFDPHARIRDMDVDAIDAAFLYPTLGLFSGAVSDIGLAAAIARAYNLWLADYCAAYPDRLFGVAMLPMQSIEHAVSELRFARTKLGFHAAFIRPNPYNGRLLGDPAYDVLWAEAQELDCSIGVHEGVGGMSAASDGRVQGPEAKHIASHTIEMMLASLNIIWNGVCERYPKVRFGFLESSGGWMAPWLDRMDRHFDEKLVRSRAALSDKIGPPRRPSEYFARQCWIAFEPVETCLPILANKLGPHKILWATDYPHRDGFFPGAPGTIAASLPEEASRKVLGQSARDFYKLQ